MNTDLTSEWFLAAREGRTEDLLDLLRRGADINAQDHLGDTALHKAADWRHPETIRALIAHGIDLEIRNNVHWTALTEAAYGAILKGDGFPDRRPLELLREAGAMFSLREAVILGDVQIARQLLDRDSSLNVSACARFIFGDTFLMVAAGRGHLRMVRFLLDHGADVEGTDDIDWTALMRAAESGHAEVVKELLDRGADPNNSNSAGAYALSGAAVGGHREAAEVLIAHGAPRHLDDAVALDDVELVARLLVLGQNPEARYQALPDFHDPFLGFDAPRTRRRLIMYAAQRGNVDIIRLLAPRTQPFDHSCDPHSVLAEAAKYGHLDVVRFLVGHGADVAHVGNDGETALSLAKQAGHSSVVEYLETVLAGAALPTELHSERFDEAMRRAELAAEWFQAASEGNTETLVALLERGEDINSRDLSGRTALMLAVIRLHIEAIRTLLDHGADPNAKSHNSWTPLTHAIPYSSRWMGYKSFDVPRESSGTGRSHQPSEPPARLPDDRPLDMLLAAGARPTLREAILMGDVELAATICDRTPNLDLNGDARYYGRNTFLILAAELGRRGIVNLLIDRGADVNRRTAWGRTPLKAAANKGHIRVIDTLLDRGANIDRTQPYEQTALSEAVELGQVEMMRLMLARGADPRLALGAAIDVAEADERGPGNREPLDLLLSTGVDVSLREAILLGDVELARQACDRDPTLDLDGDAEDPFGATFLMTAARYGHVEIVKLLLDRGAGIDAPCVIGVTALMEAAGRGHLPVISTLLDRGADVSLRDSGGWTALDHARRFNRHGMIQYLDQLMPGDRDVEGS